MNLNEAYENARKLSKSGLFTVSEQRISKLDGGMIVGCYLGVDEVRVATSTWEDAFHEIAIKLPKERKQAIERMRETLAQLEAAETEASHV